MKRFNLKKLNDVEVRERYRVKYETGLQLWKNRMIRTLESIRENIKTSATESLTYYELKQLKTVILKEAGYILTVAESTPNKLEQSYE
jgi:hypothetical protein